jgi:hypothetical protein
MVFEELNPGAVNPTSVDLIKRYVLPVFRGKPAWEALFEALATGDAFVADNNAKALNQLFLSTATGEFLTRQLEDRGFRVPKNLSFTADDLRALGIVLTSGRITHEKLKYILNAFYGDDTTRTFITCTVDGPYTGFGYPFDFNVTIDGRRHNLVFTTADFVNPNSFTAQEFVNALNIKLALDGSSGFAKVQVAAVRLFSGALGLSGTIKIHDAPAMGWPVDLTHYQETPASKCYVADVDGLKFFLPVTPSAVLRGQFVGAYVQPSNPVDGTLSADRSYYSGTAPQAIPSSAGFGPYVWDPTSVIVNRAVVATLTTQLVKGNVLNSIDVSSLVGFPTNGEFWVVVGLNTQFQTPPMRILSVNGTNLRMWTDGGYVLPVNVPGGNTQTVHLVIDRESGVPPNPEDKGSCYITGTSAARAETVELINQSKAAGIPSEYVVVYPGDRGLAGEGLAISGPPKLADKLWVWGSDEPATDWKAALNG